MVVSHITDRGKTQRGINAGSGGEAASFHEGCALGGIAGLWPEAVV
jgi:hypothetical protein